MAWSALISTAIIMEGYDTWCVHPDPRPSALLPCAIADRALALTLTFTLTLVMFFCLASLVLTWRAVPSLGC